MGQLCDSCRRSALETAASQPSASGRAEPHGLLAATKESAPTVTASSVAFSSGAQELRRRGIRPNLPGYNDTPLLTVGKHVRIRKETGFRKALIECVNDDGTVDVAYEDGEQEDETVPNDTVRRLEGFDEPDTKSRSKEQTTEERRQMGIRANAPAYNDTPLLSVGKLVRIRPPAGRIRRAEIEYVDEAAGVVEVRYRPPFEAWPGVSAAKKREREEESVPCSAVQALEEVEIRRDAAWSQHFKDNFYGAIVTLKDGGDGLFMEVKDYDAALEYHTLAIEKLKEVKPCDLCAVIVRQETGFMSGNVDAVDAVTKTAFVKVNPDHGSASKTICVDLDALIPIHEQQLALQGSLYSNRARIWTLLDKMAEANRDLFTVITMHSDAQRSQAWHDCVAKARLLRAKIRLSLDQAQPAKEDVKEALSLDVPQDTSDLMWTFYREMEKQIKEKQFDKDVSKFALSLPLD